jgi:hypothetical protein
MTEQQQQPTAQPWPTPRPWGIDLEPIEGTGRVEMFLRTELGTLQLMCMPGKARELGEALIAADRQAATGLTRPASGLFLPNGHRPSRPGS